MLHLCKASSAVCYGLGMLTLPSSPQGVSVQCKNCTVTGTIDILQGSVSGNTSNSNTNGSDDDGFSWDQGSFTFDANGFSAHIELEATVQPSANLLTFEAPMPSIGIPGFQARWVHGKIIKVYGLPTEVDPWYRHRWAHFQARNRHWHPDQY